MQAEHIASLIEQRERALMQTDWEAAPASIDEYLSIDFEEIGSNGRITLRQEVVNWLMHKKNDIEWSLVNFRIKVLSDEIVLANYSTRPHAGPNSTGKGSIRTSIWQYQAGQWKMIFHQATQLTEP